MKKIEKSKEVLIQELRVLKQTNCSLQETHNKYVKEHKQTEEALIISETRYRRLFESAKDGILILDAETGKIMEVNPYLSKMLGYSQEQYVQKAIWEIGLFKDIVANKEKFIELQKMGFIRYENLPLITADGKTINVEFVSNVYLVDNLKVIQCNIRDITDRKKAEIIIQKQYAQLQELNSTKDKFFSIIAHDLRSPFQGFLGLTSLLVESNESFTQEELSAISKDMFNSANNLYKLLENLLSWAQIQKGTIGFAPQIIDLYCTVKLNIESIIQTALQKGIEIINKIPEKKLVYADEKMINTIIRNLLSNALKFTNKGGKIIIGAKETGKELIEIYISDNGVGMTKELTDKLFKIEEKVGRIGTDGEPSTGLGLLLCKEFVEKNGGIIWVESEEGKGSTFYFTVKKNN